MCRRGWEAHFFLSTQEETPPTQPSTPTWLPRRGWPWWGERRRDVRSEPVRLPGGWIRALLGSSAGAPLPARFVAGRLGHGIVPLGKGAGDLLETPQCCEYLRPPGALGPGAVACPALRPDLSDLWAPVNKWGAGGTGQGR